MIFNHYEILSLPYDADMADVKVAYEQKMSNCQNDIMKERYKTAYYYLSDPKRRHNYDVSLGIHKYKKVSCLNKLFVRLLRVVLTILDGLMGYWWCFAVVVVIAAILYDYYINKNFNLIRIYKRYPDECKILFFISAADLLLHFYVRRANRYLKNQTWEVSNEYDKRK